MNENTQSKEITHFHGPEQISGHHFHSVLQRLQEDSIEVDELIVLLEQHPDSTKHIYAEVDSIATETHFHREIRSFKHAILLLGMNRIYALLNREMQGPELTIRRTA